MNICRLCLSEGIGYPSIFGQDSYVGKLFRKIDAVVGLKIPDHSSWPNQVCPECMGEAAGVLNFCEKVKQIQLTIEARYGKIPVAVEETPQISIPDPLPAAKKSTAPSQDAVIYEIRYIKENEKEGPDATEIQNDTQDIFVNIEEKVSEEAIASDDHALNEILNDIQDHVEADEGEQDEGMVTYYEKPLSPKRVIRNKRKRTPSPIIESSDSECIKESEGEDEEVQSPSTQQKFSCPECKKTFATQETLKTHQKNYHGDEAFPCKTCGLTFKSEKVLSRHALSHTPLEKRGIECDKCDFRCSFPSQLKTHTQAKHSSEKPKFPCGECGKNFTTKQNLQTHEKAIHTQDVTLEKCPNCGKEVRRLKKHLTNCMNDFQLKCPTCGSVHPNKNALNTHIQRMHGKDKGLECEICGKVLSREASLKEHMAKHTNTALYKCQYCPREFFNSSNRNKHLKSQHKTEWFESQKCKSSPAKKKSVS